MKRTLAIIDANVVLHYDWTKIDWKSHFSTDHIELIATHPLITEIDKKKYEPGKIGKRARAFQSSYVDKLLNDERIRITETTTLRDEVLHGIDDVCIKHALATTEVDNLYVACAIILRDRHPDSRVVLVSADRAILFTAKSKNVDFLQLGESNKIAEEADDQSRTLIELRLENEKLRNRVPRLQLRFKDDQQVLRLETPSEDNTIVDVTHELEVIRKQYPLKNAAKPKAPDAALSPLSNSWFQDAIERYNNGVERYLKAMTNYLQDRTSIENERRLRVEIPFYLHNLGTCAATDVRVFLHIEDGCSVFKLNDIKDLSAAPDPPPPYDPFGISPSSDFSALMSRTITGKSSPPNVSSGMPRRTNSYEMEWLVRRVRHQDFEYLGTLILKFDSFESVRSIPMQYEVISNEMPDKTIGKLNVVFG